MPDTRHTTTVDIKVDDRDVVKLGQEVDRAFSGRSLETFGRAMERQSQALGTLIKQLQQVSQHLERQKRDQGAGAVPGQREPMSFGQQVGATSIGTFLGELAYGLTERLGNVFQATMRGGMSEALMQAAGPPGAAMAGVAAGAQRYYQEAVGAAEARMGAYGKSGAGAGVQNRFMRVAAAMGIDPMQAPGLLGQLATSTGLQGRELGAVAPAFAAAHRFGGIENAGAVVGAAGEAGGRVSAGRATALLQETIGAAIESGVRESRLDEYFGSLSGWVNDMRQRGIPIEPESINALVRGIGYTTSGQSLQGMAGLRAAQGVAGQIQQSVNGQGRGMLTAIMMKQAMAGGKPYAEAMADVEANPLKYFPAALRFLQQQGASPGATSLAIRYAFPEMSRNQALDFAKMNPDVVEQQMAERQASVAAGGDYMRRTVRGAPLGALPVERGRRLQEIGLGESGAVIGLSQHLLQLDLSVTRALLPGMAKFTDAIVHAGERIARAAFGMAPSPADTARARRRAREKLATGNEGASMFDVGDLLGAEPGVEDYSAEYVANLRQFGKPFADKVRAEQQQQARQQVGPAKAATTGDPKSLSDAAAGHLNRAADLIQALGHAVKDTVMDFTEAEASGGN